MQNRRRLLYASLLSAVLCVGGHSAQAQDDSENFRRYITTNENYTALLNSKISRLFRYSFQNCDSVDSIRRIEPDIIKKPYFSQRELAVYKAQNDDKRLNYNNIHLSYGQWIEHAIVTGCDQKTQLNFIATAFKIDELPQVYPLVNGQTRIDITNQDRAIKTINDKVSENFKCYEPSFALGSRFLGYKAEDSVQMVERDANSGWYEQWIVQACNQYFTANMAILPDAEKRYKFVVQAKQQTAE